jgi:hypothetical protein
MPAAVKLQSDADITDEEIVIIVRRGGKRKPEIVSQGDRTDPEIHTEEWRTRATETLSRELIKSDAEMPCAFTILGCLGSLGMDLTTSSEQTDGVWDAIVHLISRPRTFEEVEALVAVPCRCEWNKLSDRHHRAGRLRFAPLTNMISMPFAWAIIELCRIFGFATELCRDHHNKLWKSSRRPRDSHTGRLLWPQKWEQLFPHGPDSFRGILAWFGIAYDRTFYAALFEVISGYLMQCHGIVMPALVNSEYVASTVIRYIDDEESNWNANFVEVKHRLSDASIHLGRLMEVLDFLGGAALAERLKLLQLMPGKLLVAMDKAMTVLDEQQAAAKRLSSKHAEQFHERWMRFFLIGVDIMLWLPPVPERRQLKNLKRLEDAVTLERKQITATPAGQLTDVLKALEMQQHCNALDCTQTFLHQGARFRYCSGCLRVPYCSKRCAKRAWRHPDLPHREVCQDIHSICHRLHIRRTNVEQHFTDLKDSGRPFSVEPEGPCIVKHLRELRSRRAGW